MSQNEELFNKKLKNIFIGEEIKGKSGHANLMRIKSNYFDEVFQQLNEDIDERVSQFDDEKEFREELYSKLYTFMKKYFSDSGSIYFTYTPLNEKTYEEVYDNNEDVNLFWKTHMLYYVKTDTIWNELEIENKELDGEEYDIHFDVSEMEGKDANEKTKIKVFLESVEEDQIEFSVEYHSHGMSDKAIDDIRKGLKNEDIKISNEEVRDIVGTFRKQNEVDFFINKDAEGFLKEQFDMWLKQYVLDEKSVFKEDRLKEIKAIRETAYDIIDFVSQFEEELKKVWNKPKFALNSNYVITLDKIMEKEGGREVIEMLQDSEGWKDQVEEWRDQEMVEKEPEEMFKTTVNAEKALKDDYKFLPIDSKYFDQLETDILELFENISEELDGRIIHSENYQALNTISQKFWRDIDTVYADPPFNKEKERSYDYRVKYYDPSWITMLENRITIAREMMSSEGAHFVRCDHNGNAYVRMLMNDIFGKNNFKNELQVGRISKQDSRADKFNTGTDSLFFYAKNPEEFKFTPIHKELEEEKEERWHAMDSQGQGEGQDIFGYYFEPPEGRHWTYGADKMEEMEENNEIRIRCRDCGNYHTEGEWNGCPECGNEENVTIQYKLDSTNKKQIDSNWTDIPGYTFQWDFKTENSEKLLRRVIKCSSEPGDKVMDFYLGSGTTIATAHKMGREWVGIEMGEQFSRVVVPRMKQVLFYDSSGISERDDIQENYNKDNAGGFFKYYELEQYEQALKKCTYEDSKPFDFQSEKIYNEYVFLNDDKMLDVVDIDREDEEVNIDLTEIYPNVDLAETLSNIKGKKIMRINENSVEFVDGEVSKFDKIKFKDVKPLIWWD
jgi:adenine specific DNA methylase Mod